ncbi:histidine kinase [Burkholderia sp. Nafp2/4-1b]|uniref:histidine kinase n=1 Tax=Burkholderia sp. Nafp2/4-1b TaxID=2116686 RepID=UPI000EF91B59|nr:histidine kinase [Burkholderia sp. Nafp2/4-1b]RKU03468.1 histidine kinase [Burkholderia sp. Nafp2/4-1b]
MSRPAPPGRQLGRAIALLALVAGLAAGVGASIVDALQHPPELPRDALQHDAFTYPVLATLLLTGLLAAAADLCRLIRRTLDALDSAAHAAGRIVAGDLQVCAMSRNGGPRAMSQFIEDFNAMTVRLKHATADADRIAHAPLAELEVRLDEIRMLAAAAGDASDARLLHCIDDLFRLVDGLQAVERHDTPTLEHRSRKHS